VGFGKHQVGLGGFLGVDLWLLDFSFVFGFHPVLVWGFFDVLWGLRWVSLRSRFS